MSELHPVSLSLSLGSGDDCRYLKTASGTNISRGQILYTERAPVQVISPSSEAGEHTQASVSPAQRTLAKHTRVPLSLPLALCLSLSRYV